MTKRTNVLGVGISVLDLKVALAEIAAAVRARFAPSTCAKFVDEVLWRTYWKGWLEQHPETWTRFAGRRKRTSNR